jgi:hypothetical protein
MSRHGNSRQQSCTVVVSAWLALSGTSCTQEQPSDYVQVGVTHGALGVQLNCGGLKIDNVNYAIQKAGVAYRAGTFAVPGPGDNFSALVGQLDPGDDYTIMLDALATSIGAVRKVGAPCTGSAGFGIQVGETTGVAVTLHCDVGPQDDGNLVHERQCPGVDTLRALPAEAPIGKCVVLEAVADAIAKRVSALAYHWDAHGGALQDIAGERCGFVCSTPGIATISVELHDEDALCAQRFPLYVTCRGPGTTRAKSTSSAAAAGSGAAAGAGGQ